MTLDFYGVVAVSGSEQAFVVTFFKLVVSQHTSH